MNKWTRGHVGRFWDLDSFKKLNYIRQPVTQEEIDQWVEKGYDTVKSYTGSMYDSRNPMPEWVATFDKVFGHQWTNLTYTFYKMSTLEIMPEHVDHYRTYTKLFGAEYKNVCRILVMLEDWKPGHYLEIDGKGIVNWIAGDWFMWESDTPHAAANIGVEDRYTLQITCETANWDSEKIWKNIHWYNIPGLQTIKESKSPMMLRVVDSVDNNNGKPWMVYMYNEEIEQLKNLEHPEETISYLNEQGLIIYLYEPLCSYVEGAPQLYPPKGTKHNMWFYSEFTGKEDVNMLRSDELNTIQHYIRKNKLTNVTVKTCDYGVDKYYPYYNQDMKLEADDLFVKTLIPINVANSSPSIDFTKKFMCLNWRYAPHRGLLAAYVSALGDNYCSWAFRGDLAHMAIREWYNMYTWEQKNPRAFSTILSGIDYINRNAPLSVDVDVGEPVIITHDYFIDHWPKNTTPGLTPAITNPQTQVLEKFYRDIFCDIVTETRFAQTTGNFSEKSYQPMYYKKPFVVCAPPYTLRAIKEQGFKTFNEFWDESYDECEEHEQRLFKIFEVIDFINDKSIEELKEMYAKMIPILEYNRNLLSTKVMEL